MLEQEQLLDDSQFSGKGAFDLLTVSRLVKASGWINFISILLYILGSLLILIILYALVIEGDGVVRGDGLLYLIFYLMFVGLLFIVGRQLQVLASATRALRWGALTQRKVADVCIGLKRAFVTFGVVTLLMALLGIFTYLYLVNQYSYYNY
ncbi:MAG: hypothetical protein AAF433_12020 [Bacteroidota bacterium]